MTAHASMGLEVRRLPVRLTCDARRTITRFFWPGEERAKKILSRVAGLDDGEVDDLLLRVTADFTQSHPDLPEILREHCQQVMRQLKLPTTDSPMRQLLIGTYFTMEYAHESAALFNPSMVPARRQDGPEGGTRFFMSLRAVGEGHISSIVFRKGTITSDGQITIDPMALSTRRLRRIEDRVYEKAAAREHLNEVGLFSPHMERLFARLGERFSAQEASRTAEQVMSESEDPAGFREAADRVIWLARSNYQIEIPSGADLSELVVFPIAETESQGMEDMRLVTFTDDKGVQSYCGTYTAFNGSQILPQMMISKQAGDVSVHTLHGSFARNKGLALFPRMIDGQYLMIGRCDAENLYLLKSKSLFNWNEGRILQTPKRAWEFVQIGNCGSPIETEAGWLVLTHGVGPMRKYCIGAMLLDLRDPSKVIGQLSEPLLTPEKDERIGYVPNVVYSCGGMIHDDLLIIPYGISDAATGFATVPLGHLLAVLTR